MANRSVSAEGRITTKTCSAKGCDRQASGRFCASHYRRRRNGEMGLPIRGYNQDDEGQAGGDSRHHQLLWKYRITQEERDRMFADQDGKCAVCQDAPAVHVDYDRAHDCNADPKRGCRECVRGGVCSRCNTGLAFLEDDLWRKMAYLYLEKPPRPFAGTPDPTSSPKRERPFSEERALLRELGLA